MTEKNLKNVVPTRVYPLCPTKSNYMHDVVDVLFGEREDEVNATASLGP